MVQANLFDRTKTYTSTQEANFNSGQKGQRFYSMLLVTYGVGWGSAPVACASSASVFGCYSTARAGYNLSSQLVRIATHAAC